MTIFLKKWVRALKNNFRNKMLVSVNVAELVVLTMVYGRSLNWITNLTVSLFVVLMTYGLTCVLTVVKDK